jgi:hypothetical protein
MVWYYWVKVLGMGKKAAYLLAVVTFLFGFWALGETSQGIVTTLLGDLRLRYLVATGDGHYQPASRWGYFHGEQMAVPAERAYAPELAQVLGETAEPKRIEVDLTNQRLYAFEGDRQVFDFPVSTGKWGRTPPGQYQIYVKLRYTLMAGGSRALGTYYYLPNVPFTMYFEGVAADGERIYRSRGYGLHGTYWHNNFGHPMSHGCVNMRTEDAEKLFYWTLPPVGENVWGVYASANSPGTSIRIYGQAPAE